MGKYKAGVCVDMDSIDAIVEAVREISTHYETYLHALKDFLNECSVEESIQKIIQTCEEYLG